MKRCRSSLVIFKGSMLPLYQSLVLIRRLLRFCSNEVVLDK